MNKVIFLSVTLLFTIDSFSQNNGFISYSYNSGLYSAGSIYQIDNANIITEEYPFYQPNYGGSRYKSLIKGNGAEIFGISHLGGFGKGNIFKYDINLSTYTNLFNMDEGDTADAHFPFGGLLLANNNKLYGISREGGTYDLGVLYEFDLVSGIFRNLVSFNDTIGKNPQGALVQHPNGKIYGLCHFGRGLGSVFEFDPATEILTKKASLGDYNIGVAPDCSFTLTSTGKLFSVGYKWDRPNPWTYNTGGAIIEYDVILDSLFVRVNYIDSTFLPSQALFSLPDKMVEDSTGMLYGFNNNTPKLFRFNPTILGIDSIYTFGSSQPLGNGLLNIAVGPNNKLYGITSFGGTNNLGVIFSFDPLTRSYSVLYNNSIYPNKIVVSNNKIYTVNESLLIELDITTNNDTIRIDPSINTEPTGPIGKLLHAMNGMYYGATSNGGIFKDGTIYQYDPILKNVNVLVNFEDSVSGSTPNSSLIEGVNGNIFGYNGSGIIYEYDYLLDTLIVRSALPSGFGFSYTSAFIKGHLTKANNGKLYGVALETSGARRECIFEYDPFLYQTTIKQYYSNNQGRGRLLNASDGNLYFTTYRYGQNGKGTLYKYNVQLDSLEAKYEFPWNSSSSYMVGQTLLEVDSLKLLGFIENGGTLGAGVLYEYDIVLDSLKEVFDFSTTSSRSPIYIKKTSNNTVIGYTESNRFAKQFGEIFEYIPSTNTFTTKHQFSSREAVLSELTEIMGTSTALGGLLKKENFAKVGPNPVDNNLFILLNSVSKIDIQIFSIHGKLIYENKNSIGSQFIVDFNYPSGTYILRIRNGSDIEKHKIIKVD